MELIKVKREDLLECPHCGNLLSVKKSPPKEEVPKEEKKKRKPRRKSKGRMTEEEGQRIMQMKNEGKSFVEIAKELGRSLPTIYTKFKEQMKSQSEVDEIIEVK